MRGVSQFESDLLRILSSMLQRTPVEHAVPLLTQSVDTPTGLSRDGVELIEDQLRKGVVSLLARCGGWRHEQFLRSEQIARGTLWERSPPRSLGLSFSQQSLHFLIWLRCSNQQSAEFRPGDPLAPGDEFLLFLTYSAFRNTELAAAMKRQPALINVPLVRLMFPEDFSAADPLIGLDRLFVPELCWILEAFQPWLRQHWKAVEQFKRVVIRPAEMLALGQSQDQVLTAFLGQAEQTGRRDLARFLLLVLHDVLHGQPSQDNWVRHLDIARMRAADRLPVYRAAMAVLHHAGTLNRWTAAARSVSFFDRAEYAASQLWLADWELINGQGLCETATRLVQQADPLRMVDQ